MKTSNLIKQTMLFLSIGSAIFLLSCNEDEDTVEAPVASFDFAVDGASVTFTNTSTGLNNVYAWDFGDGSVSSAESPTKAYTQADTYTVTLTATNDGGLSQASQDVTISSAALDSEAPVITLAGDAVITIAIGDEYTDAGATANDNVDGDITAQITVTGEVNPLQPGEYTVAYNVSDAAGNAATEVTRMVTVTFDDGLLTNGDFSTGDGTGWIGNALDVRTEGGNSFNFANVEVAGNPFDVNISQVLSMDFGNKYKLSFNASTDQVDGRTIIAGIGLNVAPFTNTAETVTITTTEQRFEFEFIANFGSADSRILFDMGADVGVVVLDNISLELISENTSTLPFDFENETETASGFNGAAFSFDTDPDNSANTVGKVTNIGAEFEGVTFFLATPVDFSTDKQISMRFYTSTADVPVLMKFENGDAPVEVSATAAATGWQDLTFDFSSTSGMYSQITLFVDGPGTAAGDFLIDDIIQEAGSTGGGGTASVFCATQVQHLGNAAETASAINLTVENMDAQSMKVTITSADADAVDVLIVNNLTGPITDSPAVSAVDSSVAGTLSVTLTWNGTPPAEVELNVLWSKESFAGNWQLNDQNTTVSFSNTCI